MMCCSAKKGASETAVGVGSSGRGVLEVCTRARPWSWTAPAPRPVLSTPPWACLQPTHPGGPRPPSWCVHVHTHPAGGRGGGRHGGGAQQWGGGGGAVDWAHAVDCVRAGAEGAVFLPGEVRHGGGQLLWCWPCPTQATCGTHYRWCTLHYVMYSLTDDDSLD